MNIIIESAWTEEQTDGRKQTGQHQRRTETESATASPGHKPPPWTETDTSREDKSIFSRSFERSFVWDNVILSDTYTSRHQPPAVCIERRRRKRKRKRAETAPAPVSSSEGFFAGKIVLSYPLLPSHLICPNLRTTPWKPSSLPRTIMSLSNAFHFPKRYRAISSPNFAFYFFPHNSSCKHVQTKFDRLSLAIRGIRNVTRRCARRCVQERVRSWGGDVQGHGSRWAVGSGTGGGGFCSESKNGLLKKGLPKFKKIFGLRPKWTIQIFRAVQKRGNE